MAYPVTNSTSDILDGLNYALSGPGGLGQNFAGFTTYEPGYLTGNFRTPFSEPSSSTKLYVAPINLSNAQQLDSRTIKYTFTTAQATPPFAVGNGLTVTGISPSNWNSASLKAAGTSINQIGVIECTTTYVTVRTVAEITVALPAYVSGGAISYSSMDVLNSTDCDVRVTVLGGQERVFISAQLDQLISYTASATADLTVYVDITRYTAYKNYDPTNPDFVFDDPVTITEKVYEYTGLTGSGTLDLIETVFTTALDSPGPGYFRYIVEVYFETFGATTDIYVTTDELRLRSITAQVIKP